MCESPKELLSYMQQYISHGWLKEREACSDIDRYNEVVKQDTLGLKKRNYYVISIMILKRITINRRNIMLTSIVTWGKRISKEADARLLLEKKRGKDLEKALSEAKGLGEMKEKVRTLRKQWKEEEEDALLMASIVRIL